MNLDIRQGEKPHMLVAFGLLLLAFLSRFYGVWEWHITGDEYFTAFHSHERYTSFVNQAYYALVVATYSIFGHDEWLSRLPALIIGVVSIPVLYITWSRVIGRNAALFAALILIFSAWHLWFSQYARFYIGVFLFSSLAYYFFYSAVIKNKVLYLVLALACSLIAIMFHATAILVPVSCAVAYLGMFVLSKKSENNGSRIIKIYLGVCVLIAIPALLFFMDQVLTRWLALEQTWGYGPLLIVPQVVKYLQVPIVIVALFGWLLLLRHNKMMAIFFAAGIGVPVVLMMLGSTRMSVRPDYIFYILPLVVILSGVACAAVWRATGKARYTGHVLLVTVIICLLPEFFSHYTAKKSLHFKEAVSFVEKNFQENDGVLSFINGFNLYAEKEYELLPFISFERDRNERWQQSLNPLLETHNRVWLVISSKRAPLAPELDKWLHCNARLVWRKHARRQDYEVYGYQVFLATREVSKAPGIVGCGSQLAIDH
ncbi:MAG: glycosyltransferase family 39 protein [Gammaproteobacteria bacterium]|nr:glycosyltransferase family 39 protein [Gammaproteobacteria bacterium]